MIGDAIDAVWIADVGVRVGFVSLFGPFGQDIDTDNPQLSLEHLEGRPIVNRCVSGIESGRSFGWFRVRYTLRVHSGMWFACIVGFHARYQVER